LLPADFGLVAVALSLNQFTNVLVGAGLVDAVIQRQGLGERDVSTVFWMSAGAALCSYLVLYGFAPTLAA
jgi:O-antigen/teichoic acid export membrane protein